MTGPMCGNASLQGWRSECPCRECEALRKARREEERRANGPYARYAREVEAKRAQGALDL